MGTAGVRGLIHASAGGIGIARDRISSTIKWADPCLIAKFNLSIKEVFSFDESSDR